MGLFTPLVCAATALVLLSPSSAQEDGPLLEQREVKFELPDILQEIMQRESVMQKEVDLTELLGEIGDAVEADPVVHQAEVPSDALTPRGRRPVMSPPAQSYRVVFPPARPSSSNLQAICLHGDRRPLYSDSYFPSSGYGQLKRRAEAINNAESWFRKCCQKNQTEELTLCCVTQAWELTVDAFCTEDTSVKDRIYECCKIRGSERLTCFERDAPNSNYEPTEEIPLPPMTLYNRSRVQFHFDKRACKSTHAGPKNVKGKKQKKPAPTPGQNVDISFPPGRPTAANVQSICRYRKHRPHYDLRCLPPTGYGWLARQSKSINRLEKGFKQCCKRKNDVFTCADTKWQEEMDRFCKQDKGTRMNYPCCEKAEANEIYECFQGRAPHPSYDLTPNAADTTQEASLNQVCGTHKIIKKKFPVGFPLGFVNQCCPLSTEEQNSCILERLGKLSGNLCRTPPTPAVRKCCRRSTQDVSTCLSKILMDAVSKATKVSVKKKRKCPLS